MEASQYLQDLRLEEEQARAANMHINQKGRYQIIKESLDAEEAKFNAKTLKAREKSYERAQRKAGVRSNKNDVGDDDSSEEEKGMCGCPCFTFSSCIFSVSVVSFVSF